MYFHARAMSAWSACGQPSASHTPCFQSVPRGTTGQASRPRRSGLTDCHTSTYGCPTTSTCGPPRQLLRDAGLLGAGHEVVDEHAQPASGVGCELVDDGDQVVDAAQVLDRDALDPQVVAPHLLDELGVVASLDVDAARQRDAGAGVVDGARAGCRPGGPGRCGTGRRDEHDRPALEQEAGPEREHLADEMAVLELDGAEVALDPHDLAAESGDGLLDHQAALGHGVLRATARRLAPVAGQDVRPVTVSHAAPRAVVGGTPRARRG